MKEITSLEEYETLLSKPNVVIDMYAQWCGPCKRITKPLEELEKAIPSVVFVKMDVDKMDDMGIPLDQPETIPCILYLKNGEEVDRVVGSDMKMIKEKVDEFL